MQKEGFGEGRDKWMGHRIFTAVKILSDTAMMDYVIIHLSKRIVCITPRVNPFVKCRLWAITTCRCRLIRCHKCTSLVGDVKGEAVHMWGQGVNGKSLCLPS